MTKEQAIRKIRKNNKLLRDDPERLHSGNDNVLCELLESLGHGDLVELYNQHSSNYWYA